jgi:hypothetical protein
MMVMLVLMIGAIRPLLTQDADTLVIAVTIITLVLLIPVILPMVVNM